MHLLKSLEDQGEVSDKEKNDLYTLGSKPGVLYGFEGRIKSITL